MNENPETKPFVEPEAPVVTSAVERGPAPVTPAPQPSTPLTHDASHESLAKKINRTMAYILIISGISFVLIAILAIWNVFGDDAGTVVWRSLGSLGAIALGALIVSVASKIISDHQK